MAQRVQIEQMIAKLEQLGPAFLRDAMPPLVAELQREQRRTIDAGTTPYGEPWAPRKADGGKPLRGAFDAIEWTIDGTAVILKMTGINVRHNFGGVKGRVKRQVIPRYTIPPAWQRAIRRVLDQRFKTWSARRA